MLIDQSNHTQKMGIQKPNIRLTGQLPFLPFFFSNKNSPLWLKVTPIFAHSIPLNRRIRLLSSHGAE